MDAGFALPTRYGYEPVLLRHIHDSWCKKCDDYPWSKNQVIWEPTCNWSQGGPIIEREVSTLLRVIGTGWIAQKNYDCATDLEAPSYNGPTALIAAMRCFVASKLGDEVDVPDELA